MSARATWKGVLKISLVTIPIKVFPATESSEALSFNQLHAACQTRIQQKKWCPSCDREVPSSDLVKGYEFEKGKFVLFTDEDFDKVKPESTRVIDLVQFVDAAALDPIYLDRAYYLAPDGGPAADAYAVIREGLQGKVGIGKVALYGREYLVAVRPSLWTLLLHTLHHAGEIRPVDAIEDLAAVTTRGSRGQVRLARSLISRATVPWVDLASYTDAYRAGLQKVIDAKIAGEEIVGPVASTTPHVANLRDALTRSLEAVSAAPKVPAKVTTPARKRKRAG